ncbi:glycolate oxidase subunit GlcE [Methyloversatilis sp. XJ19-49]|uniref:glycolate oxidase subunit GlcE n=1 Tax=Methyloversatilis sp. XJ19-49 TaxID=2963429 RepID=UPI00211BC4E4|nr:glycolate oxidase subunit GlcE [Methyloversatilis sp. XJ19-49]MCQ9378075.1 glycolate oxidase subunit GlcE [Methyloversatilis sp. XJ19-49]
MTHPFHSTLREMVLDAAAQGRTLRPHGSRSKDFLAQQLAGAPLDMRGAQGVIAYEPSELYITAHAGSRVADIEALLAGRQQMLAFEPPLFGPGVTVGGMVASGLSGPRRMAAGSLRDFVLGVTVMDGQGRVLRFGGQVMKNVAGFDVSRLIAGSFGTLGLILDVTLKVLPLPHAEQTRLLELDNTTALRRLREWGAQPLPISATCWHGGRLHVRLSGAQVALDAAAQLIGGEVVDVVEAAALWQSVRNHTHAFFDGDAPLWRVALPPMAPHLALEGDSLTEWNGLQRWLRSDTDADALRHVVGALGGHATLFRGGRTMDRALGVFEPLKPEVMAVSQRLKKAFDPSGVFSPGRLYPEL